jgi:hypothetical protein
MVARQRPWAEPAFEIITRSRAHPTLTGDRRRDAQAHEKLREEIVAEVLSYIYLIGAKKIVTPDSQPIVTVGAARRQAVNSSGVNQAAHCSPGQIFITGLQPGQVILGSATVSDDGMMAAARLNGLFARTEDLHRDFNYVDSRLEERGLREAFGHASSVALAKGLSQPKTSKLDRDAILHCFGLYKKFKTDDLTPFELAYDHIEGTQSGEQAEDRLIILGEEGKVAEDYSPEALSEHRITYLEETLRDV